VIRLVVFESSAVDRLKRIQALPCSSLIKTTLVQFIDPSIRGLRFARLKVIPHLTIDLKGAHRFRVFLWIGFLRNQALLFLISTSENEYEA